MTPAGRYEHMIGRAVWIFPAVAVALGVLVLRAALVLPGPGNPAPGPAFVGLRRPPDTSSIDWSVLRGTEVGIPAQSGALAQRFRLAGTFFVYGGDNPRRKAVIEEFRESVQHIVGEGARLGDDVTVVRIFAEPERVVLRGPSGEEELWLSFSERVPRKTGDPPSAGPGPADVSTAGAAVPGRLGGRRVGESSWVFQRDAMMGYYAELMDEPDRLLKVFDSMEPVYDDTGGITGYVLNVQGEQEFFEEVGLRQDDYVHAVNSLPMTRRSRAEFFIKEFIEGRASAFVLEIERDGKPEKLVYQVR